MRCTLHLIVLTGAGIYPTCIGTSPHSRIVQGDVSAFLNCLDDADTIAAEAIVGVGTEVRVEAVALLGSGVPRKAKSAHEENECKYNFSFHLICTPSSPNLTT